MKSSYLCVLLGLSIASRFLMAQEPASVVPHTPPSPPENASALEKNAKDEDDSNVEKEVSNTEYIAPVNYPERVKYDKAEMVKNSGNLTGAIGDNVTILFEMRSLRSVYYKLMRKNGTKELDILPDRIAHKPMPDGSISWTYKYTMALMCTDYGHYVMKVKNEAGQQQFGFDIRPCKCAVGDSSAADKGSVNAAWMSIAIVFIVLFILSCIFLLYVCIRHKKAQRAEETVEFNPRSSGDAKM